MKIVFSLFVGLVLGAIGAIYLVTNTSLLPILSKSRGDIEYQIENVNKYGKIYSSKFVVSRDYWSAGSTGTIYVLEKERVIFDGWDPTVLTFGYPDNSAACNAILTFARQDSPDANFRCRAIYWKYD